MRSDIIFCKDGFILYEKEINFQCNKINCTSWWQNFRDYWLLWLFPRMPHFYAIFGCVNQGRKDCGMRNRRLRTSWETRRSTPSILWDLMPLVSRWDPRIWKLKPRTLTVVSWTHHAVSWLHGCVHSVVSFWHTHPTPSPWLTHIIPEVTGEASSCQRPSQSSQVTGSHGTVAVWMFCLFF